MESQAYIHIVKCDIDNGWYRKVGCHDGLKSIMKEHSYFQLPILLIIKRKLLTVILNCDSTDPPQSKKKNQGMDFNMFFLENELCKLSKMNKI